MNRLPSEPNPVDEAFRQLKAAGWTVRQVPSLGGFHVKGTNGVNEINASGDSWAEAWRIALEQALAVGMPRP
jgi:hypothetical protein